MLHQVTTGCQLALRRQTLRAPLVVLHRLGSGARISITHIEAAAEQWLLPGVRRFNKHARPDARQTFVGRTVRWLRFADMLEEEPCLPRHAHTDEVAIFARRMRTERGWAEKTVLACCSAVDLLLDRLNDRGIILDSVRIDDIDD